MNKFDQIARRLQAEQVRRRPSPIMNALNQMNWAQSEATRLEGLPCTPDQEQAMDDATTLESSATEDLVKLVSAAARVDLAAVLVAPEVSWTAHQVSLAVHQEGDKLFVLVMTGSEGFGAKVRSISGETVRVRPIVVDLENARTRVRLQKPRTRSSSLVWAS